MTDNPSLLTPQPKREDVGIETSLRPKTLKEFVGQTSVIKKLNLMVKASKKRGEPLEHLLFYGPPGLGKTSLAYVLGHELQVHVHVTSGPAIVRTGDLAAILTNLGQGDILFVDEMHRLPRQVEEMLYPAMEDHFIDLMIGEGPMARSVQMRLKHFTLVGATTRAGMMSAPLRDRFGASFRLDFYTHEALSHIISRSAERLSMRLQPDGALEIAKRSRGTPRIANRLVKRVRDYCSVNAIEDIAQQHAKDALTLFEVDEIGCDPLDQKVLRTIIEKFSGGPVGIDSIAASLSEDVGTLEDFVEPYLLQLGFIQRTPRGRIATEAAYAYLNLPLQPNKTPQNLQKELL